MGTYLNPGNSGFADIRAGEYIDKTGLIAVINGTIGTPQKLTCISRPRRFGKSYAAQMLCAYYDRTASDSAKLFEGLRATQAPDFGKHLNGYNVLYLDLAGVVSVVREDGIVPFIVDSITEELCAEYPGLKAGDALYETLANAVERAGVKFVMIIDEWDAPVREHPRANDAYLKLLRSLFKNSAVTAKLFAAVYMTGILPIKKVRTQSALSDFEEYTMLRPGLFAEYVGFTEEEVAKLCKKHSVSFSEMKRWYDGYELKRVGSVYNPNSVMKAIRSDAFDSYWTQSSAADNLLNYIRWDVDGLRKAILELMGGVEIEIDTAGYNNDLTYETRDAALTMFVHLGYLAYNQATKRVRIPNEEIRLEFARTIRESRNPETMKRVQESIQLINDAIDGREQAVAEGIRRIHMETTNPRNANREDSLRAVIQVAFFAYKDDYLKLEELPTGEGYADVVYFPKPGMEVPALVVELKWNKAPVGAIQQIKDRQYVQAIEGYGGEILLVGISYDKGRKTYECKIEKWREGPTDGTA